MIRAEHLDFSYSPGFFSRERIRVIDDISLKIPGGESVGLVGRSGSGKTTLGRLLVRSLKPESGSIFFHDTDIASLSRRQMRPIRSKLQMIFQDPQSSLDPKMKIRDSIAEPLLLYRDGGEEDIPVRVRELIDEVGLSRDHLSRYPSQLSGGQNQRVMIARILAIQPEFIVADEPTASLDVSVQAQVLRLMQRIQKEHRIGMLFISHDPEIISCMCRKVYRIQEGKIIPEVS